MRREAADTKKRKERGEPCSSPTNYGMAKTTFISLLVRTCNVLKSKKGKLVCQTCPMFGNVVHGSILRNLLQIFKFLYKNGITSCLSIKLFTTKFFRNQGLKYHKGLKQQIFWPFLRYYIKISGQGRQKISIIFVLHCVSSIFSKLH